MIYFLYFVSNLPKTVCSKLKKTKIKSFFQTNCFFVFSDTHSISFYLLFLLYKTQKRGYVHISKKRRIYNYWKIISLKNFGININTINMMTFYAQSCFHVLEKCMEKNMWVLSISFLWVRWVYQKFKQVDH